MTNLEELFDHVTAIVASPHTSITEHDKRRAIRIFLAFEDHLLDRNIDLGSGEFVSRKLDELEGR